MFFINSIITCFKIKLFFTTTQFELRKVLTIIHIKIEQKSHFSKITQITQIKENTQITVSSALTTLICFLHKYTHNGVVQICTLSVKQQSGDLYGSRIILHEAHSRISKHRVPPLYDGGVYSVRETTAQTYTQQSIGHYIYELDLISCPYCPICPNSFESFILYYIYTLKNVCRWFVIFTFKVKRY